jgi:O-acetyl-ADP-ribose deacetylase (regulator of RNase III)
MHSVNTINKPEINSVAIPGLCTGVGRMSPRIAAGQMFQAYKEIILGERMDFKNFSEAQKYHWNINKEGMIYIH